jgi:hypothetical protein
LQIAFAVVSARNAEGDPKTMHGHFARDVATLNLPPAQTLNCPEALRNFRVRLPETQDG